MTRRDIFKHIADFLSTAIYELTTRDSVWKSARKSRGNALKQTWPLFEHHTHKALFLAYTDQLREKASSFYIFSASYL